MPVSFPPIIQQHFPAASLDVLSFLNFRYPSFAPSETWKWQVKNFVSNLAPTIKDEAEFWRHDDNGPADKEDCQ